MIVCSACYGQMDKDRYDTTYWDYYLVTIDSLSGNALIKPIIEMTVNVTKEVPCSTVMIWYGESKDSLGSYWSVSDYDSTKSYGPCGYNGISTGQLFAKYKGDTIIDTGCRTWSSETFKTMYFIPDKKKKHKIGKQYILKKEDHIGVMDKWVHPKPSLFYLCI